MTENKFQRQRRITANKNVSEATRIARVVVDDYCMEFNVARWARSCSGRNLCGLRAYSRAAWSCMVQEDFIEEDESIIEVVRV